MKALRISVGFSWAWCCFSIQPDSSSANYFALVHRRVSNPTVITHDRLSEIGPGQAESRDQPLICPSPPILSMHTTIKRDRKYRELLLSLSVFFCLLITLLLFSPSFICSSSCERESDKLGQKSCRTVLHSNCHTSLPVVVNKIYFATNTLWP